MSSSHTVGGAHALGSEIDLQMSDALARNWWAIALRGALAIIFGIVTFVLPGATMLSLVFVFAAYALLDGIFAITAAVRSAQRHERWGLLILEGVVDLIAAAVAVVWPGLTILTFVLVIAAWALVTGALMMVAAFRLQLDHGRWWLVLGGLVSILYGVLLIIAPLIGALVLTWWLGGYALVFGVLLLVLAFRLRARHEAGPSADAPHAAF
ncbi:MAG TPA: HdeD family acid-resistance protein [Roseiarcus sp.]